MVTAAEPTTAQVTAAVIAYAEALGDKHGQVTTADHLLALHAAIAAAMQPGV
jgi:hypothetical protein